MWFIQRRKIDSTSFVRLRNVSSSWKRHIVSTTSSSGRDESDCDTCLNLEKATGQKARQAAPIDFDASASEGENGRLADEGPESQDDEDMQPITPVSYFFEYLVIFMSLYDFQFRSKGTAFSNVPTSQKKKRLSRLSEASASALAGRSSRSSSVSREKSHSRATTPPPSSPSAGGSRRTSSHHYSSSPAQSLDSRGESLRASCRLCRVIVLTQHKVGVPRLARNLPMIAQPQGHLSLFQTRTSNGGTTRHQMGVIRVPCLRGAVVIKAELTIELTARGHHPYRVLVLKSHTADALGLPAPSRTMTDGLPRGLAHARLPHPARHQPNRCTTTLWSTRMEGDHTASPRISTTPVKHFSSFSKQ